MAPEPVKKTQTTMRLRNDMLAALDALAAGLGWNRSQLIEQILLKHLNERAGAEIPVRVVI